MPTIKNIGPDYHLWHCMLRRDVYDPGQVHYWKEYYHRYSLQRLLRFEVFNDTFNVTFRTCVTDVAESYFIGALMIEGGSKVLGAVVAPQLVPAEFASAMVAVAGYHFVKYLESDEYGEIFVRDSGRYAA